MPAQYTNFESIWRKYLDNIEKTIYNIQTIHDEFEKAKHISDNKNLTSGVLLKYLNDLQNDRNLSDPRLEHLKATIVHNRLNLSTFKPSDEMKTYLADSIEIYKFMIGLYDGLATYNIQKNKKQIYANFLQQPDLSMARINQFLQDNNISKSKLVVATKLKKKHFNHLKQLFANVLTDNVKTTLVGSTFTVQGEFIRMSSIPKYEAEMNANSAKFINIFASNTIFIDSDYDKTGKEVQLSLIAPKWVVIKPNSKIILNGSDAADHTNTKAATWNFPGGDGKDGKSGNPGGPAGKFLGIAKTIDNANKLKILANGGIGGNGQDGGDGYEGRDDIRYEAFPDECEPRNGFENELISQESFVKINSKYSIIGKYGTKGGNGGNSGDGGLPGNMGDIVVLNLGSSTNMPSIQQNQIKGKIGIPGKGNVGGKKYKTEINYAQVRKVSGTKGKILNVVQKTGLLAYWSKEFITSEDDCSHEEAKYTTTSYPNGLNGRNSYNRMIPEMTKILVNPSYTISEYKSFAIYMIENTKVKSTLSSFLKTLQENNNVKNYYTNLLDYARDLQQIEYQHSFIKNKSDLVNLYKSIKANLPAPKKSTEISNESIEDTYLRSYINHYINERLKTTFDNDNISNAMIKLNGTYLNNYTNSVNVNNIITKIRLQEKTRDENIKNSENQLKTEVEPKIEEAIDQVDSLIEQLINDIIEDQNQLQQDEKKLATQKADLKALIALKGIMGAAKVASTVVAIFIPPVAALTVGMEVIDSTFLTDKTGPVKVLNVKPGVTHAVKLRNDNSKAIKDLKTQIENIKEREEILGNLKFIGEMDAEKALNTTTQLTEYFKGKKEAENQLSPTKLKDKKEQEKRADLNKRAIEGILKTAEITISTLGSISEYSRKTKEIDIELTNAQKFAAGLEAYEKTVKKDVVDTKEGVVHAIRTFYKNLNGNSAATLNVGNFNITQQLDSFNKYLGTISDGYIDNTSISTPIGIIKQAITTMTKVYEDIEHYYQHYDLLIELSKQQIVNRKDHQYNSFEMTEAVEKMELLDVSNKLIDIYMNILPKYKSLIFPLSDSNRHLKIDESASFDQISTNVYLDLKHIESTFQDIKTDKMLNFFTLDNNSPEVQSILEGNETVLFANITTYNNNDLRHHDAVKFKNIGIKFAFENKKINEEFMKKFGDYTVSLTHSRDSIYKCGDKYVTVHGKKDKFTYTYKDKHSKGNSVLNQPHKYLMSPYTNWTIQLKSNDGNFEKLKTFVQDEMFTFKLVGEGTAKEPGLFDYACNDFNNFYGFKKNISQTTQLYRRRRLSPKTLFGSLLDQQETGKLSGASPLDYSELNNTLLLADLLIRKTKGSKAAKSMVVSTRSEEDADFANSLAYSAYAPSN